MNKKNIYIGEDLLELLSTSMYVEPLTLFREYIQNATDSIDEKIICGDLKTLEDSIISIDIFSKNERKIIIRDNGKGIAKKSFEKKMLSLGGSEKRFSEARGFRGVGRFSGLGYCKELIFRTKVKDEHSVSEIRWNSFELRKSLNNSSKRQTLTDIINNISQITQSECKDEEKNQSFFEVELSGIKRISRGDILLNEEKVYNYLSQNAPVEYKDNIKFKREINNTLNKYNIKSNYQIFLKGDFYSEKKIQRPYENNIIFSEQSIDQINTFEPIEIQGNDGNLCAIGWLLHHNYKGAIPNSSIRGIRVRIGNIQIGNDRLLIKTFKEVRFNSWSIGEIHILDKRIIPNGRRDNFEFNTHWDNLLDQFTLYAEKISNICRKKSSIRNLYKRFESEKLKIIETKKLLKNNVFSNQKNKELKNIISFAFQSMSELLKSPLITKDLKKLINKELKKEKVLSNQKDIDFFQKIPKTKHAAIKEIFDLIYSCSTNSNHAFILINKIKKKYGALYKKNELS